MSIVCLKNVFVFFFFCSIFVALDIFILVWTVQLLTGIVHVFDAKTNRTLTMGSGLVSLSISATITAKHRLNEPCFYCYSIVFLHTIFCCCNRYALGIYARGQPKSIAHPCFEFRFFGHQTLRKSNTCTHHSDNGNFKKQHENRAKQRKATWNGMKKKIAAIHSNE